MLSTYYVVRFLLIIFHDSLQTLIPTAIPILHCALLNNRLLPCRHITNLHSFVCIFPTFSIARDYKSLLARLTLRRAADQVRRAVRGALQVIPHKDMGIRVFCPLQQGRLPQRHLPQLLGGPNLSSPGGSTSTQLALRGGLPHGPWHLDTSFNSPNAYPTCENQRYIF